jgi:hypothetical protein
MAVAAGDGEAVRLASGVNAGKHWCSSGEDEGTKGGGDPSEIVNSSWAAAHRRGGELHTVARLRLLKIKMHHRTGTIFRAFALNRRRQRF